MVQWRKSTRSSGAENTDCVEVAAFFGSVAVRDSKAPDSGHLAISRADFDALVAQVKQGSSES
ncbi:DUF397 domain-containing protein [Actinomadura kijaniata]|uniref:DUF397 domain-containing protein n=1 Tax=Actinomadura namibiensis TaxID=182080 RepID=A0A7W3LMV8_ACTNM|nr:DUF397 domain-containing protein [Actinomadura namibiensis]MBA8951068.1 hypothetical protein [Actinomadura namibiensis]